MPMPAHAGRAAVNPGDAIAVLRQEPDDFAKALRLTFRAGADDLDWMRCARIRTANGRMFELVRHRNAPGAGTEVVTASASNNPWRDILAVLERLRLTKQDITWRHPAAKPASSSVTRRRSATALKK